MKALAFVSLALCAVVTFGCATQRSVEPQAPTPITQLDFDQLNKLIPFMVERRKHGEPELQVLGTLGEGVVLNRKSQAFTFALWLDEGGHPVPPPKGDAAALKARPTFHHGTFVIYCTFSCTANTSGGPTCEMIGCEPFSDDTCGCTPLDCPGCTVLYCDSNGWGAIGGSLVMM
jgi:hypothetical protein